MSRAIVPLEVRGLTKVYESPPVRANDGISFSISRGETFGLLGPNGAGKSTLVKQVVGLLEPTSGDMFLFGERVDPASARRVARSIAYLPQGSLALGELEVAEAIVYTGMLRGLPEAMARNDAETIMEELDLGDLGDRQIRKLSGGQRRLTQVGMTLIGNLPVLILDEPTADIDPALRARIWDLLEARARDGAAILLVTHDVLEAEHVLGRVAIVDKGRVRMSGTPGSLKADLSHRVRVELVVAEGAAVEARLLAADLGDDVLIDGRRIRGWVPREQVVATLDKVMGLAAPEAFEDVRLVSPSLEDVYLDVVGHPFEEPS